MKAQGDTIRREREQCGFGLGEFARRIGISASWLSRIERDLGHASPDVLRRIALALRDERAARDAIAEITRPHSEEPDESGEAPLPGPAPQ